MTEEQDRQQQELAERRKLADRYGVSVEALGRVQEPDPVQDEAEYLAARYGLRVASVRRVLDQQQEDQSNG